MATDAAAQPKPKKASFKTFFERSALVMFGLGFAAGMPNMLIGQTLVPQWLLSGGANLSLIGMMSLVTISYALKFLWSPLVDKVAIPVLDGMLGRRRSWMLVCQLVIIAGIIALAVMPLTDTFDAQGNPKGNFLIVAGIMTLICFAGATQDVAIDAWRIEVARDSEKLGILTANYQIGYRVAVFISGAVVLLIIQLFSGPPPEPDAPVPYTYFGWAFSLVLMGVCMGLSLIATFLAPREKVITEREWKIPADVPDRGMIDTLEWVARLAIMILAACFLGVGMSGKPEPLAWLVGGLYLPGPEAGMSAREAWVRPCQKDHGAPIASWHLWPLA